jgi:hypothetical protein
MGATMSGWVSRAVLLAALLSVTLLAGQEEGMAATSPQGPSPSARICRWYGGKQAALSLRFDDSHPTQIQNALPLLNEYGCIGTFLVNPGNPGYQGNRAIWEGALLSAGHEVGDHTYNHNGAKTDGDAEFQIGQAAQVIREADPARTQLLVFLGGGGTQWMQRKPFDFFIAKYHLLRPRGGGSMSCREDTPWKPSDFVEGLDRAITEGRWMQAHFHCVGEGYLPISIASFRAVLEAARARRDEVWQSGMNSIAKYQDERDHSIVWAYAKSDDEVALDLVCEVDPDLYRQPLTLELGLPARAANVVVTGASGNVVPSQVVRTPDGKVVRFDVAPVDAGFVVKANRLGASYRRKQGPDLRGGMHPYLFFSKADLPALREKMNQPFVGDIWKRIKTNADGLTEGDRADWEIEGSQWRARSLAFAYALTGEKRYADRAWLELEAFLKSEKWHMPPAEALVTGEAAGTMAMAYDWLYNALTEDQRRQIRDMMIEYTILPTMKAVAEKEWYTHWSRGNWGGVIYGQIGLAALSILDDDPRAADWARTCRRIAWHYPQALGREGGWAEGGGYGEYLWPRVLMLADALRRTSRGQTDLFDNPNLPHLPDFYEQLLEPDEQRYVPFSNVGTGTGDGQILLRLAAEYHDGRAQWFGKRMAERKETSNPFIFLWADPTLEAVPPAGLPTAKVFRDIDWAFLRSGWDDPQATLFALKGGQKDWDHAHHDTNSFVLYAYGQPLLVDLRYPHDIWGVKTEAHNTIMVNGKDQAGRVHVAGGREDPMLWGVVADLVEAPWYVRLIGDASLAYDPQDVNSFVREVMYLRHSSAADPQDYFVLFDDVDATAPSRYDWLLHTYGSVTRDGDRLTITQGPAAVDVSVVSPPNLSCEITEKLLEDIKCRSPLEGVDRLRQVKLSPVSPSARGNFVSVLVPRPASSSPDEVKVAPVQADNVLGAEITSGPVRDLVLFALDAPAIAAAGVEVTGRTCFVRQQEGKVTQAAVHGGDRLVVNGTTLFETTASGTVVLTFTDAGIHCTTSLYDADSFKVHADRQPSKVTSGDRGREFTYDPETHLVTITGRVREVDIQY